MQNDSIAEKSPSKNKKSTASSLSCSVEVSGMSFFPYDFETDENIYIFSCRRMHCWPCVAIGFWMMW